MPSPFAGLDLAPVAGGTSLRLRVKPSARRDEIIGVHGGALKVSVTAPAERGKANHAVIDLLAARLSVSASAIEIVSGASSRDKVVRIGLDAGEIGARLAAPPRAKRRDD